jgi:hypothetical protein
MDTTIKSRKKLSITLIFLLFVMIVVSSNALANYKQMTEKQKIEYLIQAVENLEGGKFYRNGEWYTPKEAADHLRLKWENAGKRIKTVKQFIDNIATASSISGKPYKVKYKDGKVLDSRVFFYLQLNQLNQSK